MRHRLVVRFAIAAVGIAGLALAGVPRNPGWPQWGGSSQHTGFLDVDGQELSHILADIVYDPLVPEEQALNRGDLLVHYQVPLVDGDDVYMESKAGRYSVETYSSQTWHQNRFTWDRGALIKAWTFDSDWVPPGSPRDFWEPVYHAVLANGFLYAPGRGGTIVKLNTADGTIAARINPFPTIDPDTYTVSPLTADRSGNIYYNVLRLRDSGPFYGRDAVDSWLVKVAARDQTSMVSYTGLNPAAPKSTDLCTDVFSASQLPWPPRRDALPPSTLCGVQRVGLNIAPAVAADGTIYSLTRAHFPSGTRHAFLLAIAPDLELKWAASLRNRFNDGCNDGTVLDSVLPVNGTPGGCRADALNGVDPSENAPGAGLVLDSASSSPTIAPDGTILYGAYSRYNYAQGHLMRFSADGSYLGAFGFGWDTTPAIYEHDGTYSIVVKNNHYGGFGSYCSSAAFCPPDRTATNPASPEAYFVTQLRPNLSVEWSFQNTNTRSCRRDVGGEVSCVADHPDSFEWCVNAPAVDRSGVVYANSEDGHLYAINRDGTLKQAIFQQLALGAAYTPASLGGDGRIYSQNAGHLFVVGR